MSTSQLNDVSTPVAAPSRRRWLILVILALTQLVVVLDSTIVNIALPQAQASLDMNDSQRQWVITAYALAFGALLLLGGRIADYWGRKRAFLVGMVGFGAASAFGGFAQTGIELILARGAQGAFAALMAPAALALLTVTFTHGRERNTAFAIFGAVAGAGAALGLVLGGLLTEFADWRWCLWVNVPVAIIALVAGLVYMTESKADGDNRYDVLGTITIVLGLGSLVYGFTLAEDGWGSLGTIGFLAAGVVFIALFVWIESRSAQPLLPLRVILNRVRGGALILQAISGSVMIGAILYLVFHLQIVLGFGPLEAGLAALPMTVVIGIVAPIATSLLPRIGPRPMLIAGPLFAAGGLMLLSTISVGGNYFTEVLPGLMMLGIGMGLLFVNMQNLALVGVAPHDAGAAGAMSNASMQIGGSIGLSIFTTLYASTVRADADPHALTSLVDGYQVVFVAAAIAMVVASVVAVFLIRGTKEELLPSAERLPAL